MSTGKGPSFSNGPGDSGTGNSGCNGNSGPLLVRHGEHCACIWCLMGHKG